MLRVRLLKILDRYVGAFAVQCIPSPTLSNIGSPRRFLIIRPGGIGDAVLLIPAIRVLHEKFPDADITVLAERRNGAMFAFCPSVKRVLLYDRLHDLQSALSGAYDVIIDTEQWHRLSAVCARLPRAGMRIGFATNGRRRLFTNQIPYSHDTYEVDSFLALLEPLGCKVSGKSCAPYLLIPESALIACNRLLLPCSGKRIVVLFPGASIPERRWGADRFHDLARRLSRRGLCIVVIGGPGDVPSGEVIVAEGCGINLAGRTNLAETAAIISRAEMLVTGDSGMLHLAVGLDVPTVSLFGPGIAMKWAPRGKRHRVLNKNLECSPCTRFGTTPSCLLNAQCLKDIDCDEVEQAVNELFAEALTDKTVSSE